MHRKLWHLRTVGISTIALIILTYLTHTKKLEQVKQPTLTLSLKLETSLFSIFILFSSQKYWKFSILFIVTNKFIIFPFKDIIKILFKICLQLDSTRTIYKIPWGHCHSRFPGIIHHSTDCKYLPNGLLHGDESCLHSYSML